MTICAAINNKQKLLHILVHLIRTMVNVLSCHLSWRAKIGWDSILLRQPFFGIYPAHSSFVPPSERCECKKMKWMHDCLRRRFFFSRKKNPTGWNLNLFSFAHSTFHVVPLYKMFDKHKNQSIKFRWNQTRLIFGKFK